MQCLQISLLDYKSYVNALNVLITKSMRFELKNFQTYMIYHLYHYTLLYQVILNSLLKRFVPYFVNITKFSYFLFVFCLFCFRQYLKRKKFNIITPNGQNGPY